ncbi:MAG TPA: hypothetical protein VFZ58_04210 [Candidatus Saccharimonadales bacterium]
MVEMIGYCPCTLAEGAAKMSRKHKRETNSETALIRKIYNIIEDFLISNPQWRTEERSFQNYALWRIDETGEQPRDLDDFITKQVDSWLAGNDSRFKPNPRVRNESGAASAPSVSALFGAELQVQVGEIATLRGWNKAKRRLAIVYAESITVGDGQLPRNLPENVHAAVDQAYVRLRKERYPTLPLTSVFVCRYVTWYFHRLLQKQAGFKAYPLTQRELAAKYAKSLVHGVVQPGRLASALVVSVRETFARCCRELEGDLGDAIRFLSGVSCDWFAGIYEKVRLDDEK